MSSRSALSRLPRQVRAVAVVLVGAVVATAVATVLLDLQVSAAERHPALSAGAVSALIGTVLVGSAAVTLNAEPGHGVGVALAGLGMFWALDGLMEAWAAYSYGTSLMGTDLAVWFVARLGAFLLPGLTLVLLLYPTGRLMPGRWRHASVGVVLAACGLPVMLLLAPDHVVFRDMPLPGVRTDWLALPLSEDATVALLTVTRTVTLLALLGALLLVVARHRLAQGLERIQLRWLLWAGIVCALTVVALAVLPSGGVTTFVLAVAVILTSVSVTLGVVRPHVADIDALVAGTLTYAGVAGVVVAGDLLAVAGANAFLGEQLEERDVTLLVLLVAVAVYGPLRSWLGAGVRRVLFGRRGDRYDVMSAFAARMEQTRSVEEQLPALAEAVAATFKVAFVRVEVYGAGGTTLSAVHGREPARTREHPIGYQGRQVGRLVLPEHGLRSMLTRGDRGLLMDVVRQAAVAVRSSTLARELQESREHLVRAREDDRRRIRRDLHDGLGPVLGGVAMRLDAAGNAVGGDDESARKLIRQSREDVAHALADVRRLVHDLRPPALDDLGLLAAVEQQAERARNAPLDVEVDAPELGPLPAAVEVAAYRIVAEALNNVVRHAEASRARVTLRVTTEAPAGAPGGGAREHLALQVSDDGRGIAPGVPAGVGLLSLRERVEELGGSYEVSCPEDGGTTVRAWLPTG